MYIYIDRADHARRGGTGGQRGSRSNSRLSSVFSRVTVSVAQSHGMDHGLTRESPGTAGDQKGSQNTNIPVKFKPLPCETLCHSPYVPLWLEVIPSRDHRLLDPTWVIQPPFVHRA